MTTPQVQIPEVIEGYSDVRVVWYNAQMKPSWFRVNIGAGDAEGGPPVLDPEQNTQNAVQAQLAQQAGNAKQQLTELNKFPIAARGTEYENGNELITDGDSDVAQMSWNKDMESPAGVLNLVLFPKRDYAHLMQPEDILIIYGRADKYKPETMLAMVSVDSVRLSRVVDGSGATIERVNVTARDLGKVLMETPTVYDQAFGGKTIQKFFSQFVKAFTEGQAQGGPSLVVQTMLAIFFSIRQNFVTTSVGAEVPTSDEPALQSGPLRSWRFPGTRDISLFSYIDLSSFVQTPMVGALVVEGTVLQNAGNLWQLCDMYANRLVNEFFIDTRDLVDGYDAPHKRAGYFAQQFLKGQGDDGTDQKQKIDSLQRTITLAPELLEDSKNKPELLSKIAAADFNHSPQSGNGAGSVIALVHRQYPYDTFSFYMLPTTVIYETEVFDVALERGSHDILNFFRVRFPGLVEGVSQDLQFGTTINRLSCEQHGIRRFEGESIYPYVNDKTDNNGFISSFQPTFDYYMSCVTAWYAYNERLLEGTMTMRFRPDIRIGTRLTFVYTRKGKVQVSDFYVQRVSHTYTPQPNTSRTTVDLVRGVERLDVSTVGDSPETHLYWTNEGRSLDPDPYETVVSEDIFTTSNVQAPDVQPTQLAPDQGDS